MLDLSKIKKIHIIGIEGAGTSALARVLKLLGKDISGSDEGDHFYYDGLKQSEIKVVHKFNEKNIPSDADLIVYGTSLNPKTNQELAVALKSGIKVVTYAEALGALFNEKIGIAVCGTHGKTTTTAMLAEILRASGADPSAIVGSKVINWQGSSLAGNGKIFVAETDEYQNKLQYYNPFAAVLTSVDWDHPDFFPTPEEYQKVFIDFVAKIPRQGFLIVWGDSSSALEIAKNAKCEVIRYGFLEDNDAIISKSEIQISNQAQNPKYQKFKINFKGEDLGEFEMQLVGDHNILNAAAAIAVCHKLKIDLEKVREALKNFQGTSRRFEYIGECNGAILIDDYAHHPEEIKATLKAAREIYPEKNIITIFHPHTFTRTKALLSEFSQSFSDADEVIIIDIYGSAREVQGEVSSEELVNLINKYDRDKARYIPTIDKVIEYLKDKISAEDVVISMGAGDVWKVVYQLKI